MVPDWLIPFARQQVILCAFALDIIQYDFDGSRTEFWLQWFPLGALHKSQLFTDDICVVDVPFVIADGAPLTFVVDLYPTLVVASATIKAYSIVILCNDI